MDYSKFSGMRFYTKRRTEEISEELEKAVVIPVNIEIATEHRVYNMTEMREILRDSNRITVHDCGCKTEYDNCESPRDVCISINKTANEVLHDDKYNPKEVTLEEAIQVLEKSHRAGLVHLAYTMKGEEKPELICSCCPCCCHTLGSLVRNRIHTQILTSNYIAADDKDSCIGCGICVERCVFQARNMRDRKLFYNNSLCQGCGLCVSTCNSNSIRLVERNSTSPNK